MPNNLLFHADDWVFVTSLLFPLSFWHLLCSLVEHSLGHLPGHGWDSVKELLTNNFLV